jgi:hypothetical protein
VAKIETAKSALEGVVAARTFDPRFPRPKPSTLKTSNPGAIAENFTSMLGEVKISLSANVPLVSAAVASKVDASQIKRQAISPVGLPAFIFIRIASGFFPAVI